jgi:hypothetical protein
MECFNKGDVPAGLNAGIVTPLGMQAVVPSTLFTAADAKIVVSA